MDVGIVAAIGCVIVGCGSWVWVLVLGDEWVLGVDVDLGTEC